MRALRHAGLARPDQVAPVEQRVLLACDGGSASAAALRWLIDYVGARPVQVDMLSLIEADAADAPLQQDSARGMAQLLALVAPAVDLTVVDAANDPVGRLTSSSNALVVIGAHRGDRRGRHLVEAVLAGARSPVIVVPSEWICREGAVAVGIGAEDGRTVTLAFAERQAALRRSEVRLIHVWDTVGPGEVPLSWDLGTESIPERQGRALARFDAFARDERPDLRITAEARQGRVVKTLTEAAKTASLLVVGRSHHGAVIRAIFGSTAKGVLSQVLSPVAVVP